MAMALILLRFFAVESWIAEFPLIRRTRPQPGAGATVRHSELIGIRINQFTAVTQGRKRRKLA
jgi:hypothetical protein